MVPKKKNLSTETPCAPPTQASLLLNPLTTAEFIFVILPFPECHGRKRKINFYTGFHLEIHIEKAHVYVTSKRVHSLSN